MRPDWSRTFLLLHAPLLALAPRGEAVLVAGAAPVHEGPAVPHPGMEVPQEHVLGAAALHHGLQTAVRCQAWDTRPDGRTGGGEAAGAKGV